MRTGLLLQVIGIGLFTPLVLQLFQNGLLSYANKFLSLISSVGNKLFPQNPVSTSIDWFIKQSSHLSIRTLFKYILWALLIMFVLGLALWGYVSIPLLFYTDIADTIPHLISISAWILTSLISILLVIVFFWQSRGIQRIWIIPLAAVLLVPSIITACFVLGLLIVIAEVSYLVSRLPINSPLIRDRIVLIGWLLIMIGLIIQYNSLG